MIAYVICIAILLYTLYVQYTRNSVYHFAKQVGGPKGYPIIGNAWEFMKHLDRTLPTLSKFVDECGDRFVLFLGSSPVLVLNNAEDLEKVHKSTDLTAKSEEYDMLKDFLGNGLLISRGQHWHQRRKLIGPCFHLPVLERFIGPSNAQAEILVNILKENFKDNTDFMDICPFMQRCALDIICETSMGIKLNSQMNSKNAYVEAVNKLGELFIYRCVRPLLRNPALWKLTASGREEMRCLKTIHSFTDQVVADRKKSISFGTSEDGNLEAFKFARKSKKALLDMLLDLQRSDEKGISDEGIREETTTFMFACQRFRSGAPSFDSRPESGRHATATALSRI